MAVVAVGLPMQATTASAMVQSLCSGAGDKVGVDCRRTGIQRGRGRGASGGGGGGDDGGRRESLVCLSSSLSSCSLCGALASSRCSTSTGSIMRDGGGGCGESSWASFVHGRRWRREGVPRNTRRFNNSSFSVGGWGRRHAYEENSKMVVTCSGADGNNKKSDDDQFETLFMRELRRRGMSSKEQDGRSGESTGTDTTTKQATKSSQSTDSTRDDQLKRSMALNSEGLDGLIPRATELVKLGGTYYFSFWPFIALVLATFLAVYLYFGPGFIHTGNRPKEPERYVDPYQLLEREELPSKIGPSRVPFSNSRVDDAFP